MSEWSWKVPTARGTRWEHGPGSIYAETEGWPRVNVYCEGTQRAPHPLYLIGSFVPSSGVWEQLQRVWWTFVAEYSTGDGSLLKLHQREALKSLDDGRLRDPTQTLLVDTTVLATDAERVAADQSKIRSRYDLHCQECGLRQLIRSDNPMVQTFASTLYSLGRHEVSLSGVSWRFTS